MAVASISVVVPTYNRGEKLVETVEALLRSATSPETRVEIIVVDDGSMVPAQHVLDSLGLPSKIRLEVIRHQNAGPAFSRNQGFRRASGDIVLFMDDDVIAPPNLLTLHARAHLSRSGSVICGVCDWRLPVRPGTVVRSLKGLAGEYSGVAEEFVRASIVASGQLSVERSMFDPAGGVYCDSLVTPAAEEYELSARLRQQGIPIYRASRLVALHDSPLGIADLCRQQFKHGVGCAEAARRCPESLALDELARVIRRSTTEGSDGLLAAGGKRLRGIAASRWCRRAICWGARVAERTAPQADIFGPLYRLAVATHFLAGVREGLLRFAGASRC